MFGEWDPALADALLQRMTPDNARVDVQSASWEHIRADIGKVSKRISQPSQTSGLSGRSNLAGVCECPLCLTARDCSQARSFRHSSQAAHMLMKCLNAR